MNIEGVVIFDADSGIPLFSRLRSDIDSSLFSSFVAAIGHFSKELKLGGLSSFTTEEKVIYLAARESIITALIAPVRKEYQEAYSLADELGKQFEVVRNGSESLHAEEFSEFNVVADSFLKKIRNPFTSRVSEYIHEKYGGEISIKPRLMKESGSEGTIDMIVNLGPKSGGKGNGGSKDLFAAFSDSYIFVKTAEGRVSRGDVMDFIDAMDGFGTRIMRKGSLEFLPYFPTRAVIMAREYTEPVFEFLKNLPRDKNGVYLDGSHVFAGFKGKGVPKQVRCYFDVYKWLDNQEVEQISL